MVIQEWPSVLLCLGPVGWARQWLVLPRDCRESLSVPLLLAVLPSVWGQLCQLVLRRGFPESPWAKVLLVSQWLDWSLESPGWR